MAETLWIDGPRRKSLDKAEDFRRKGKKSRWKKMQRIQISEDQGLTQEAKKRAKEKEDTSEDTTISVADQGVKEGAIDVEKGLNFTGHLLRDAWKDTKEFKEWYNLPHNIGAIGARAIQSVGDVNWRDPKEASMEVVDLVSGKYAAKKIIGEIPIVQKSLTKLDEATQPLRSNIKAALDTNYLQPVYETIGIQSNRGLLQQGVDNRLGQNVFAAISKEGKASQTFKDLDKAARNYAEPRIKAGEKYPLAGFNKKFVDPKDGQIYTVGTYTSSKTGVTKYVYKNKEGKAIATLNRNAARKLDEDTLRFQFSRYQSEYPNVDLVESYRKTNRKVYTAIEEELRELNAEGIAKFGRKNWKELQVEHIHDVQHFAKLSKEAPKFKNKGADELWNITIIPSDINARTGAQAMSVNAGDALIKATQNDTFIPYEQVTREFIDFNLAEKVQNMTKADFTALTQMILKNPNENVHQLLVNYVLN